MTVRGTQNLLGARADTLAKTIRQLEYIAQEWKFQRFIPSALVEAELFKGQIGDNRAFEFQDLGQRNLMLLPEVTAVVRQEWRERWSKEQAKPLCLFYTTRCYRYDRPQRGRYREFTQFGIEVLGDDKNKHNVLTLLDVMLSDIRYELRPAVQRGQAYYIEDGFEAWAGDLQIAGGGRYEEGIGWALGVERLILTSEEQIKRNRQ